MTTESILPENSESSLANRFRQKAHDFVDNTADQAEVVEQQVGEQANAAGKSISKNKELAEKQLKEKYQTVREKAKEHPFITLGVVFAAGALIGRSISR